MHILGDDICMCRRIYHKYTSISLNAEHQYIFQHFPADTCIYIYIDHIYIYTYIHTYIHGNQSKGFCKELELRRPFMFCWEPSRFFSRVRESPFVRKLNIMNHYCIHIQIQIHIAHIHMYVTYLSIYLSNYPSN